MSQNIRPAAVVGGARIPFARSNTVYSHLSNKDMLTGAMKAVVDKYGLVGERLGEVQAGAVLKHSRDFNLTRETVLSSGLAPETAAADVQMACGTGLQAALNIANKIAVGQIDSGIAGGVDTTSDAPIGVSEKLRVLLLDLNRAKTGAERARLLLRFRLSMLMPLTPSVYEPRTKLTMGDSCELMVKEWGITREAQDELAYASHMNAAKGYDEGFFDDLVVPFHGVKRDNNLRAETTLEKLASLKPAYDKKSGKGTLTAGNSTPLTDGASAVLLATEEWAKSHKLPVLAYLTHGETAAVDFVGKKEGLLMAPAYAMPRMLKRAGLKLQDFDYYEIHEAFAGQVLCTLKAWEDARFCRERLGLDKPLGSIDRSKLNVKGSSVAVGHPFAATGGRILHTAAKLLSQKGSGRCLISICAAGGQGVVAILEK